MRLTKANDAKCDTRPLPAKAELQNDLHYRSLIKVYLRSMSIPIIREELSKYPNVVAIWRSLDPTNQLPLVEEANKVAIAEIPMRQVTQEANAP